MVSMWAKHKLRKEQNKWCNGNRDCGYIPIGNQDIHRIGLRGRKRYLLFSCLGLLIFLTLLNITASLLIFFAFKLYNPLGAPIDYWSTPDEMIFNKNVEINNLVPYNDELNGLQNQDLIMDAHKNKIHIQSVFSNNQDSSMVNETIMHFDPNGTCIENADQFVFSKPDNKDYGVDDIFFSGMFSETKLPYLPNNIGLKRIWTPKIINEIPSENNMTILSSGIAKLRGNQGMIISTTFLNMSAFKDIKLRTKEGIIVMKSANGGILIPSKYLPFQGFEAKGQDLFQPSNSVDNYDSPPTTRLENTLPLRTSFIYMSSRKLCICGNSGRLFSVPILTPDTNCINALENTQNPCETA